MTQVSAADLKSKLINSLFLTLPHLLDCLICTSGVMSNVVLLEMMEEQDRCVCERERGFDLFILECGWVRGHGYHLASFVFFLYFCIFSSHVFSPFI